MDPVSIALAILGFALAAYIWSELKKWANNQYDNMKRWVYDHIKGYGGIFGKVVRTGWGICVRIMDMGKWVLNNLSLLDAALKGYEYAMGAIAELQSNDGAYAVFKGVPTSEVPTKVKQAISDEGAYRIEV